MSNSEKPETQTDSPDQPAKNGKKRRLSLMILAGVIVVAVIAGTPFYIHSRNYQETDDAFIEAHVTPVSPRVAGHVLAVHIEDNQWVEAGTLLVELDPRDFQAHVTAANAQAHQAEIATHVKAINVDVATTVSGAATTTAEAGVISAKAAIKAAEAEVKSAEADRDESRADASEAQAHLDEYRSDEASLKSQKQRDEADLKRFEELTANGSASEQELEHARTTAEISSTAYESARLKTRAQESTVSKYNATIASAEGDIAAAQATIDERKAALSRAEAQQVAAGAAPLQVKLSEANKLVAEADFQQSQAQQTLADLQLSYTSIKAPVSGYVTRRSVEMGAFVQPGQPLLSIVQPDMWVVANFKETQLTRIKAGQPVEVSVDTYPDESIKAHVDSVQWGTGARFSLLPPENATGNYIKVVQRVPVKIVFDDPEKLKSLHLGPGMSVVPEVKVSE